jgi:hypothetical protein
MLQLEALEAQRVRCAITNPPACACAATTSAALGLIQSPEVESEGKAQVAEILGVLASDSDTARQLDELAAREGDARVRAALTQAALRIRTRVERSATGDAAVPEPLRQGERRPD